MKIRTLTDADLRERLDDERDVMNACALAEAMLRTRSDASLKKWQQLAKEARRRGIDPYPGRTP